MNAEPSSRPDAGPGSERSHNVSDYRVDRRLGLIVACAAPVGAVGAGLAWCLLRLIGLITNLVWYSRLSTALVSPAAGTQGKPLLVLFAPVAGGMIVGLMARFGSERIRGHGMPEAIEAILVRG